RRYIEENDEQRRTEAEKERGPGAAADLDGLRADLDSMFDQEPLEAGIDERGESGLEGDARAGLAPGLGRLLAFVPRGSGPGIGDWLDEPTLYALPLAVDG